MFSFKNLIFNFNSINLNSIIIFIGGYIIWLIYIKCMLYMESDCDKVYKLKVYVYK